jgi:NADH:ubiquinone oxidoreductase subunit E
VLPCLRRIQEDRGFVADEDIDGVVAYLGVPRIQVEEVLSFYGSFGASRSAAATCRSAATCRAR